MFYCNTNIELYNKQFVRNIFIFFFSQQQNKTDI